jgi:hypothetical protein
MDAGGCCNNTATTKATNTRQLYNNNNNNNNSNQTATIKITMAPIASTLNLGAGCYSLLVSLVVVNAKWSEAILSLQRTMMNQQFLRAFTKRG